MHRAVYARTAEEYCQYKVGSLSTYYPGDLRDCGRLVNEERICGSVCGACEPGWEFPEPGGTPPAEVAVLLEFCEINVGWTNWYAGGLMCQEGGRYWNNATDPCLDSWYGITCDTFTGRHIYRIQIPGGQFSTLPESLSGLPLLQEMCAAPLARLLQEL